MKPWPKALPTPVAAPHGRLEQVARLLLHRAAPFDRQVHAAIAEDWALSGAAPFRWLPDLPGDAAPASRRVQTALQRLRRITTACPPPTSLSRAVALLTSAPWLTEHQATTLLQLAGLTYLDDPLPLTRALATLWIRLDPPILWPTPARQAELRVLTRRVRSTGVLPAPEAMPAGEAAWLRLQRRIQLHGAQLVASPDYGSGMALPIRRQLAVLGAVPPAVLIQGCSRRDPAAKALTDTDLVLWASAQPDVVTTRDALVLSGGADRWLAPTDRAVLTLFQTAEEVNILHILSAARATGRTAGSAEVWLAHCVWLRGSGRRGHYRLAQAPRLRTV